MKHLEDAKKELGAEYSFKTEYTPGDVKIILGNNNSIQFADEVVFTLKAGKLGLETTITAQSADKDKPDLILEYEVITRQPGGDWENYKVIGRRESFDAKHFEQEMFEMLLNFAEENGLSFIG